jgi:hypothetical protein
MSQLEKITALADEAGMEVMDGINGVGQILVNRENLTALEVRKGFEQLGVEALYDQYIGPAIDAVEAAITDAVRP